MIDFQEFGDFGDCPRISVAGVELGVLVTPMKIPLPLRGIRVIREIRGQKKQPRITQISRKTHHKSHLHSQWRAAGSWKLGGEPQLNHMPRNCTDGPLGRLYGSPPSRESLPSWQG